MTVHLNTQAISNGISLVKEKQDLESSREKTLKVPLKVLSKGERVTETHRRPARRKVVPVKVVKVKPITASKKISAVSVAGVAIASGTTVAVSGIGAWALEQTIGFAIYMSFAPTNGLSQYLMAQMTSQFAASIVSATILSTITNIALGVLVGISIIFASVAIYNWFIAETNADKISIFSVIGKTISAGFRLVFAGRV
jgi:hypothetical protein